MKKRILVFLLAIVMLFALSYHALAATQTVSIVPNITFNGTKATCSVSITGNMLTDTISATMTLKRGTTVIDEWTDSGSGFLYMSETADVARWKTYTLTVNATINGVAKPEVTISRTNN